MERLESRWLLDAGSFDFGPAGSPVRSGTVGVSTETYTPSRGYGWATSSNLFSSDRGIAPGYVNVNPQQFRNELNALGRDFVYSNVPGTFLVDLPNGSYDVTAALGDYLCPYDKITISAEGKVATGELTTSSPGKYVTPSFRVDVADGRLDLTFADLGGMNPFWLINALEIRAVDSPSTLAVTTNGLVDAQENSLVRLSAAATGGSGTLGYTYDWDLDADGTFEVSGQDVSIRFPDNGTYTVNVRATDGRGGRAYNTALVRVANVAPTVSLSAPAKIMLGEAATFSAKAGDVSPPDVAAGLAITWDFGDGEASEGTSTKHTYKKPGTYTVTAVATDKDGAQSRSQSSLVVGLPASVVHEHIPHYGEHPTVVSAGSGLWSDPATWSTGRVPAAGDVVAISMDTEVVYDLQSWERMDVIVVHSGGQLRFRTDIDTEMLVGTLMVMPGGILEVGTETSPVEAGVQATITIADMPIDTGFDPEQFGTGLVGLGKVTMHGAPMSATFIRLASEPKAGDTTLVLEQAVDGWRPGDRLYLPDTRQLISSGSLRSAGSGYYIPQYENPTIKSISGDGRTISLSTPLRYDHRGARNAQGVLEFLPHVANLSRNVVIRSENPEGTRGHTLFHDRADVDIRYTSFLNLGRTTNDALDNTTFDSSGNAAHVGTNQIGRYPIHVHHVLGPESTPQNGYQFTLVGNSIDDISPQSNFKWGLAVHSSSYGLVRDNVIHNMAGAGLVTEDGSESYNVIEHNFVGRINGIGGRGEDNFGGWGRQGYGIWLRGPNNYVRDNVVANVYGTTNGQSYGYALLLAGVQDIYLPISPGGYPMSKINIHDLPILEFVDNEFYGTASTALTFWYIGSYTGNGVQLSPIIPESVIKDFRAWHFYDSGIYVYPSKNVTMDGFVARGDTALLEAGLSVNKGLFAGDYKDTGMIIRNSDIQGLQVGISPPTLTDGVDMLIENSTLNNYTNIHIYTMFTSGLRIDENIKPRKIIVRNVTFGAPNIRQVGNQPMLDFDMQYLAGSLRNLIAADQVYVYDYNGVQGNNFRVYYDQQRADFIVPQSIYRSDGTPDLLGAPVSGLTNQQAWQRYGIAIAGEVAPAAAVHQAKVKGLVNRIP